MKNNFISFLTEIKIIVTAVRIVVFYKQFNINKMVILQQNFS